MNDWGRVITAMVTPMKEDGQVDYEQSIALAKRLVEEKTSALVISGTTGESPTLTAQEKETLFKLVKQAVNVPVIAGVGTNSTAASIENALAAQKCGVDGLLCVVPYYNKPNQESLYAHFEALNNAAAAPIMLYNVPGRTGVNMTAETSTALSKLKNITALKEASGDLTQLSSVVRDCADGFRVYTGDDAQILPTMAVGGYGVVSVASNIIGVEIDKMISQYLAGDVAGAKALHLRMIGIFNKLFVTSNPIPLKAAFRVLGRPMGPTRLPLLPASQAVLKVMTKELKTLGYITDEQ